MATILVIDDHPSIRALLRIVLENAGHQVLEAANGRLGLDIYRQHHVNLVITDIDMPEMNGLELMLELTRHFLNVKVIAISGCVENRRAWQVAKLLGARQTLQKPFDVKNLVSMVNYDLLH